MKEKIKMLVAGIAVTLIFAIIVGSFLIMASLSDKRATLGMSESSTSTSRLRTVTRELTRTIINQNTKRLK